MSFDASEGTLLCVLGKNRTGKSTLFRCILGLLKGYRGIQSTHNPEHVFLFTDEVLVMLDGKTEAKGPDAILTEELLQRIYGIRVNLYEIEQRTLKFCVPDKKEIQ